MKTRLMILTLAILTIASFNLANAGTARLQVIHNAADPAASTVDVYAGDGIFIDNFAFRAATPFTDINWQEGNSVTLPIGVAPGNSESSDDIIASFNVTFEDGLTYVAIANGVLDPMQFASNPDGMDIGFTLYAINDAVESADDGMVKVIGFHGATDAPAVDIYPLYTDVAYGEFTEYAEVPADAYTLEIRPAGSEDALVAYTADLSGLGGGAAVAFASGFLSPGDNQNGEAFGLFAALPNGTVVEFPTYTPTARLQVIHNAADPAAASVDVYVNDGIFIEDFDFRAATPFVDVPAEVELTIGIAPGNSNGPEDIIATFDVTLADMQTYVVMANGVLDPMMFAENPDGLEIGFNLYPVDNIVESADDGMVKVIGFHGATDAPAVDIYPLYYNVAYGEFTEYAEVPADAYTLEIRPAGSEDALVAYTADLSGLGGGAAVAFASGFLSPGDNQNGEAFGLFAALPNGTVVEFPVATTDVEDGDLTSLPATFTLNQNYPNPFNPTTNIKFNIPESGYARLTVFNVLGQEVETLVNNQLNAGEHTVVFNASNKPSGVYFYKLSVEGFEETRKMILTK